MKVIYEAGLDQLIKHIKTALNGKEPTFSKNSGFNKTKTDAVENDTNKLFTAKGAYDLKNTITTAYTSLVNTTKSALETSINTKLSHGGYSGTAQSLKTDIDGKLPNPGFGGVHELGRYLDLHLSGSTADYDARIFVASDKSVSVGNSFGALEIGPKNTSHCHIYTDRPSFYFNKELMINGNRVYHLGFKPSKADVGLGSVNDWGASSAIGANSTTQYATTNMVAQVRSEKLNEYVLPIQRTSYRRSVVALVKLTTSGFSSYETFLGDILAFRGNALNGAVACKLYVSDPHNGNNQVGFGIYGMYANRIRPCTFTKGGVLYGGIEIFITDAEYSFVKLYGYLNNSNGNKPYHAIDYLDTRGDVLDAEINGSINFNNFVEKTSEFILDCEVFVNKNKRVYHEGYKPSKSDIGLGSADNTADSAKNVLSATRFTTARTINGTSFDGSGNIVTANWGTARNLQIGNTAKSVNGSGNVTWSLAEIGAVNKAGDTISGPLYSTTNYIIKSNLSSCSMYSSNDEFGFTRADNAWVLRYNKTSGNVIFTSTPYVGGNLIYHAGNKPTKADVGLGSVNNWGASSSISANSTTEYATTNMVAQVRGEKANVTGTLTHKGNVNLDTLVGTAIAGFNNGEVGRPADWGGVLQWANINNPTPGTNGHWLSQLAFSTNDRLYHRTRTNTGGWTGWGAFYSTKHKPTAADVGALPSTYCPYRVGDILTTKNTANPAVTWPGTTWKKIEGRFLYGSSTAGQTGGSSTKTLSVANMPSHNHGASGSSGAAGNHSHTANHNHSASQSAHAHTQPAHTHGYSSVGNEAHNGYHASGSHYGFLGRTTSSGGAENTGSAQPTITVNTTNVTTSSTGDHSHSISVSIGSSGSGSAFDIMPPYETVHIWERLS